MNCGTGLAISGTRIAGRYCWCALVLPVRPACAPARGEFRIPRAAELAVCTLRHVLITLTDARRRLGRIITQARISGEPVTITDMGEPVATLVPLIPPQRPTPDEEGAR